MSKNDAEQEVSLALLENDAAGERSRIRSIARRGLPKRGSVSDLGERRRLNAQYRACVALGWDTERILVETGWNLTRYQAIKTAVEEEDARTYEDRDSSLVYATYVKRQELAMAELDDLALSFRKAKQFSALVNAVKAKSDILDKIVKTGLELGIIRRTARITDPGEGVNVEEMEVDELRIHVQKKIETTVSLLGISAPALSGGAGAVMRNIMKANAIEATTVAERPAKTPRVKRLRARPRPGAD